MVHAPGHEKMSFRMFHDIVNEAIARLKFDRKDGRREMRGLPEDVGITLGLFPVVYQRRVGIDGMDKPRNTRDSRTKSMGDGISCDCGRIVVEATAESR
jgi:hypothetical protein